MTIDIHHHMLPRELVNALTEHSVTTMGGEPLPAWRSQASLDMMDRTNIDRAILSAPIPLHFVAPPAAATMATEINRFAHECTLRWPDRFGYFASLPLPDVESAVAEATSTLDQHGAAGVAMLTNHAGIYQGDPRLDPLYEELNKRQAVAFVHPTVFAAGDYPVRSSDGSPIPCIQPSQLEFGFDSTRAVANLLLTQVDRRFPDIRFVFTHSATCVPCVLHKLLDRKRLVEAYTAYIHDHGTPPPTPELLTQLQSAEAEARQRIRWFYFDTALSTAAPVLDALTAIVDTTHILFGTDFPFGQEIGLQYTLDGINSYPNFTDEDRTHILATNAADLLDR
ncbi:MAG TPA: amidohydrolase family protein [Mycobacterium sp.]|nr:amidohydrolase family protein [Mycobacterium sp.]